MPSRIFEHPADFLKVFPGALARCSGGLQFVEQILNCFWGDCHAKIYVQTNISEVKSICTMKNKPISKDLTFGWRWDNIEAVIEYLEAMPDQGTTLILGMHLTPPSGLV